MASVKELTESEYRIVPDANRPPSAEAAAIVWAAEEFARTHDQSVLLPLLGTFEDMISNEEFDRLRGAS